MAKPPQTKAAAPARRPSASALSAPADRELAFGLGTAALVYFVLALVYFLPAFFPGRHIFGTDYLAGSYMFYSFIGDRLAAGELPKWVPYIFGGLPLYANPGSTYYPPFVLFSLLLPTERVFPALFVFQFWVGGVGMYLLARELGCRRWVAFVAGLAFQWTGIIASWVYAGHDGRIIVSTFIPLVFFFLHRGIRTGAVAPFAGVAASIGMALLSFQIQNSYYLLLSAALWSVFCLVHLGVTKRKAALARTVALGLGAVAVAFVLSAVNFLPFLDYVPESPRGSSEGRGYEYATSYSMPPVGIVAMAVPEQPGASVGDPETGEPLFPAYSVEGGFKLHTEYVGALVLLLLVIGAAVARRSRPWWFFAALSVWALTMALGGNTPLFRLYYEILPGIKRFRAPDLIYYVIAFSLVAMAAITLERLAELRAEAAARRGGDEGRLARVVLWCVVGVAGLALLGALGTAGGDAQRAAGWLRFAFFAGLAGGALVMWTRGSMTSAVAAVALAVLTVADLWVIDRRFFHTTEPADVTFAPDDVMTFLQSRPQPARVWTLPVPPGQTYRGGGPNGTDYPMLFGIQQAGGEHPNPMQRWNEYVGAGQQTYIDWHNFLAGAQVVQTFDGGQAIAIGGVPGFLNAANVQYIVAMAPLADAGLREVHRGSALIYENTQALPRAYLVPEVAKAPGGRTLEAMTGGQWDPRRTAVVADTSSVALPAGALQGGAQVAEYEPDRVVVRTTASRPAMLVLADNYYPGWRARIGGSEVPIHRVNHTFRGVVVPAGNQTVTFTFEPADLYTGFYITLAVAAVLVAYGVFLLLGYLSRRKREETAEPEPEFAPA